jgi:hypothetical protein
MTRRSILLVLASLTLAISFAGGRASASDRQPGWRPVLTLGPANSDTYLGHFVVTGPHNAWSTWTDCTACGGPNQKDHAWIERWTGRTWRRVAVPSPVAKQLQVTFGIASASADDLWLFGGRASNWNGKRWAVMKLPPWVVRNNLSGNVSLSVCDFGHSNLWVFSGGIVSFKPTVPFAARYNGHHWTKARLPGVPGEAVGLAPSDIWATATPTDLKGAPFLMHWNGKSWTKISEPKPSMVPAHYTATVEGLVPMGPDNVWLQQNIVKGEGISRTEFLWHWNGRRWARVRYGFSRDHADAMASDGRGGLWISDVLSTRAETRYLVHYGAGRWNRQLAPAPKGTTVQITDMAQIPGTQSMWAAGEVLPVSSNSVVLGEIWKFGP